MWSLWQRDVTGRGLVISAGAAATHYVFDALTARADTAAATAADTHDRHHDDHDHRQHHQQDVPPFCTKTIQQVHNHRISLLVQVSLNRNTA